MGNIFLMLVLVGFLIVSDGLAGWEARTSMPTPRKGANAVLLNGYVLLIGGENNSGEVVASVDVYDPENDSWNSIQVPPLNHARRDANAEVINGQIYIMGGSDGLDVLKSMEIYDPVQNLWNQAHDMHNERQDGFSAIIRDTLYVLGGAEESGLNDEIEWYDQENDNWEELEIGFNPPRVSGYHFTHNDTLRIFGGFYFSPLRTSVMLTPGLLWQNGPSLTEERGDGATTVVGDSVFFLGGENPSGPTAHVDYFNLRTNTVNKADFVLPGVRGDLSAITYNGRIYIFGGHDEYTSNVLDSVYVYIPDVVNRIPAEGPIIPQVVTLRPNYPNPFNGTTTIQFATTRQERTELSLFNSGGGFVTTLLSADLPAGEHQVRWNGLGQNGESVASGSYFVVLRAGETVMNQKIVYIK